MERCPSTKVLDAIPYFGRAVKMERRSEVESMFGHIWRGGDEVHVWWGGDEVQELLVRSSLRKKAGCVSRHGAARSLLATLMSSDTWQRLRHSLLEQ